MLINWRVGEKRNVIVGLAQMVERSLSMREVVGSMPTSSSFTHLRRFNLPISRKKLDTLDPSWGKDKTG